jgi:hypothetical protein
MWDGGSGGWARVLGGTKNKENLEVLGQAHKVKWASLHLGYGLSRVVPKPQGFSIEDLFRHSIRKLIRRRWLWIPKGKALQPELGFAASKRDIEWFGGEAIFIHRVPPPKPLERSFAEVVMDRNNWRGNNRGRKDRWKGNMTELGGELMLGLRIGELRTSFINSWSARGWRMRCGGGGERRKEKCVREVVKSAGVGSRPSKWIQYFSSLDSSDPTQGRCRAGVVVEEAEVVELMQMRTWSRTKGGLLAGGASRRGICRTSAEILHCVTFAMTPTTCLRTVRRLKPRNKG